MALAQTTTVLTYDANGNRISKQIKGSSPYPTVTASPEAVAPSQPSTLLASGCTGGSIQWQPLNQAGSQIVVNPAATTQYTAQCVVQGCANNGFAKQTVTVINCPTVSLTVTANPTLVKYGQSVNLFASGCNNGTVSWSSGNVGSPTITSIYGAATIFTATCKSLYCPDLGTGTVVVGGQTGCLPGDVLITKQNGAWSDASTWVCGRMPTSSDIVYISHQVTLYVNASGTGTSGYAKFIIQGRDGTLIYDNLSKIIIPQN
ncbi:hypothetical protein [Runella aurantiaca]|uniref:hypothetical protein n=1 Tax=Runella aurantiaca TaxID=2282308 RepID=UPI0011C03A49|nr:hypothetical protein [Runella aurantiaca]